MAGAQVADLGRFLERMTSEPFVDGATDCILTVSDWIVLSGHPDPAEPFRRRYRTVLGRERILRGEGGLLALMQRGADRASLQQTVSPRPGDVGLVSMAGLELAAICLGARWAAKGLGVVVAEPEEIIRAWRV